MWESCLTSLAILELLFPEPQIICVSELPFLEESGIGLPLTF